MVMHYLPGQQDAHLCERWRDRATCKDASKAQVSYFALTEHAAHSSVPHQLPTSKQHPRKWTWPRGNPLGQARELPLEGPSQRILTCFDSTHTHRHAQLSHDPGAWLTRKCAQKSRQQKPAHSTRRHSHSQKISIFYSPSKGLCRAALVFATQPASHLQHEKPCRSLSHLPAISIAATFKQRQPARNTHAGYSCSRQAAAACTASLEVCARRLHNQAPSGRWAATDSGGSSAARAHRCYFSAASIWSHRAAHACSPVAFGTENWAVFFTTQKILTAVCPSRGIPRR